MSEKSKLQVLVNNKSLEPPRTLGQVGLNL
jgi:hypothetical protein